MKLFTLHWFQWNQNSVECRNRHTWKWTNLARDGSEIKTWWRWEHTTELTSRKDHSWPGTFCKHRKINTKWNKTLQARHEITCSKTVPTSSSEVGRHASNKTCTAMLSWVAMSADFSSSLSLSDVNCPVLPGTNGLSNICRESWDLDAAREAWRTRSTIARSAAHLKTRLQNLL